MKWSTIGSKIGVGYALIILLMALIIGATIYQTRELSLITRTIHEIDTPGIDAAYRLGNGISRSMAALRGWIILGEDAQKTERQAAWNHEIAPAQEALEILSETWDAPENTTYLLQLKERLIEAAELQVEIQGLAHTEENNPALLLLKTEGIPQTERMLAAAATMISKERQYESTAARKDLLGHLAECQGTLASSLVALRTYLITGEDEFLERFETSWTDHRKNAAAVKASKNILSKVQWDALNDLLATLDTFDVTWKKMVALRGSDEWNRAETMLRQQAAPRAREIRGLTQELISGIQARQLSHIEKQQQISQLQYRTEWFLLGVGLVFSIILGLNTARAIARPIANAADVAREVADGNYDAYFNPTDIEELNRLGKALKDMQEKIETNQAELTQARSKAEMLSRTRGVILASISHALRTPVNAVIGFSQALSEGVNGPVTQQQIDNLNRIHKSGTYSLRLLNDLLELSRIESGDLTLRTKSCDLRELVEHCCRHARLAAEEKKLTFKMDLSESPLTNTVDRECIEQILSRILDNAVDYTETGEIEVRAETDNNNHVISVRDTGIGIAKDYLIKIFARFDHQDETEEPLERAGLGLMVSLKLAELHDGKITAESEVGKGSTFYLTLPKKG